ncbi:MAG: hypothetical protein COA78_24615 [Blastopirellula sp.]|nr:MAG: hypothetical protein COA78_24615 [Blastopirellula sp.]
MPTFQYNAIDDQDNPVSGQIESPDQQQAQQALDAQGLKSIEFVVLSSSDGSDLVEHEETASEEMVTAILLSDVESQQLIESLAQLTEAGLPLADGFEAAAAESTSKNLRLAFAYIAERLNAGEPLEQILSNSRIELPTSVATMIHAGIRSRQLPEVLSELLEIDTWQKDYWQGFWSALSYPIIVGGLTLVIIDLMGLFVMPSIYSSILKLFDDFEMEMNFDPAILDTTHISWTLLSLLGILVLYMLKLAIGNIYWTRLKRAVPVIGSIFWWNSTLDFVTKLRLLVSQGIPLPRALHELQTSLEDPLYASLASEWARQVEEGQSLSTVLANSIDVPFSVVPLLSWGEQNNTVDRSLRDAATMFQDRMLLKREVVRYLFQGLIVLAVIGCILWLYTRAIMSLTVMFDLIRNLTG